MDNVLSNDDTARHNVHFAKGKSLCKGRILLHGVKPYGPPSYWIRWKLRKAIRCFEAALTIAPDDWPSMFFIGKIQQRLQDQNSAYQWFVLAHEIKPTQPDVAREASLAALDISLIDEAIELCRRAVASSPSDSGLVCNLALAYCLAGRDVDAEKCVVEASSRDPADEITSTVLLFIRDIASGKRNRPKRLCDVFPCW